MAVSVVVAVVAVAGGAIAWTLLEYIGHRWLMHGPHAVGFIRSAHMLHHRHPDGLTWQGSVVFGGAFLAALAAVAALGTVLAGPIIWFVALGTGAGSVAYSLAHHHAHAMAATGGGATRAWRAHLVHHDVDSRCNFGFTTVFWDRVFGTAAVRTPADV